MTIDNRVSEKPKRWKITIEWRKVPNGAVHLKREFYASEITSIDPYIERELSWVDYPIIDLKFEYQYKF